MSGFASLPVFELCLWDPRCRNVRRSSELCTNFAVTTNFLLGLGIIYFENLSDKNFSNKYEILPGNLSKTYNIPIKKDFSENYVSPVGLTLSIRLAHLLYFSQRELK